MRRIVDFYDGCYEASRAASLAGVPLSTLYDWARKAVVVPTMSRSKPMLWSYADLMALRIVYWLRHPKPGAEIAVPASPMAAVRSALTELDERGIDIWSTDDDGNLTSALLVDRSGRIHISDVSFLHTTQGQGVIANVLDLLGPFDTDKGTWGPDLRQPMPHLRIVPGKVSGEPHLAHSRLTTRTVVALADRGLDLAQISELYPEEDAAGLREAIQLERRLVA